MTFFHANTHHTVGKWWTIYIFIFIISVFFFLLLFVMSFAQSQVGLMRGDLTGFGRFGDSFLLLFFHYIFWSSYIRGFCNHLPEMIGQFLEDIHVWLTIRFRLFYDSIFLLLEILCRTFLSHRWFFFFNPHCMFFLCHVRLTDLFFLCSEVQ